MSGVTIKSEILLRKSWQEFFVSNHECRSQLSESRGGGSKCEEIFLVPTRKCMNAFRMLS